MQAMPLSPLSQMEILVISRPRSLLLRPYPLCSKRTSSLWEMRPSYPDSELPRRGNWEAQLLKSQFAVHFDLEEKPIKEASMSYCSLSPRDFPGTADLPKPGSACSSCHSKIPINYVHQIKDLQGFSNSSSSSEIVNSSSFNPPYPHSVQNSGGTKPHLRRTARGHWPCFPRVDIIMNFFLRCHKVHLLFNFKWQVPCLSEWGLPQLAFDVLLRMLLVMCFLLVFFKVLSKPSPDLPTLFCTYQAKLSWSLFNVQLQSCSFVVSSHRTSFSLPNIIFTSK